MANESAENLSKELLLAASLALHVMLYLLKEAPFEIGARFRKVSIEMLG